MSKDNSNWIRDSLIVPILVGILVGSILLVIQSATEWFGKNDKLVLISVDGPFALIHVNDLFKEFNISTKFIYDVGKISEDYKKTENKKTKYNPNDLSPPGPPRMTGVFQEVDAGDPQIYRVLIKNTGELPIRDLPVRLVFKNHTDKLKIFTIKHNTTPKHEFGEIKKDFSDGFKPRFVYSLLNPKDEDDILIIASEKADLEVYTKAEGVSVETEDINTKYYYSSTTILILSLIAFVGAILSIFVRQVFIRRRT
jgi:hypothetical protein